MTRKLIVQTFVTLDGVMQAPGGPGEDDDGGFAYGGWSVNYWDDQMGQVMGEATSRLDSTVRLNAIARLPGSSPGSSAVGSRPERQS